MYKVTMSRKEMKQVKVLERLVKKDITRVAAAQMLNISERGHAGLIHRNCGQVSD